jgi:putative ubiquitin-RnfH superfamily antitoxin RatB of RatAB toxin-antitoxin module
MASAPTHRPDIVRVEVIYALPGEQVALEVELPAGATVGEAIAASGILARFPEIGLNQAAVGVFGERCALDAPVSHGDRVEIYRRLQADPKEARRRRARRKR